MRQWKPATYLLIIFCFVLGLASPALAQDEEAEGGQSIVSQLRVKDASGEQVPVVGAVITVEGVGEATTDEEGKIAIPVDGVGTYTVTIDESTLPDGVALKTVDRNSLTVDVEANKDKRVLFALVEGEGTVAGTETSEGVSVRRVSQLTVEGLKQGLYLAMAAIGLSGCSVAAGGWCTPLYSLFSSVAWSVTCSTVFCFVQ